MHSVICDAEQLPNVSELLSRQLNPRSDGYLIHQLSIISPGVPVCCFTFPIKLTPSADMQRPCGNPPSSPPVSIWQQKVAAGSPRTSSSSICLHSPLNTVENIHLFLLLCFHCVTAKPDMCWMATWQGFTAQTAGRCKNKKKKKKKNK